MQSTTSTGSSEGDEPSPSFAALPLDARLLTALERIGFTEPTPIQRQAIGPLLEGRDVIGRARTGSGKTAAFGLPLLHQVLTGPRGGGVRALVLAPTRELARQVSTALESFVAGTGMPILTVYGGASYTPQLRGLRNGAPVVVGTPGRLIDLLERGALDLSGLRMLVLDEADEMLRMGFQEAVERILAATPEDRQLALFSATMPPPIRRIAERTARDPVEIQVERGALTVDHIEQRFMQAPTRHRIDALVRILGAEPAGATLVFTQTRAGCAEVADALVRRGLAADALHGDLDQVARERVLHRLRTRRLDVVVATDIAARGLDLPHLTLVVNMELPRHTESYVHRIGRTGRAGETGRAITLVAPHERRRLAALERRLKVRISEQPVPSDADIARRHSMHLQGALFTGRSDAGAVGARELRDRLSSTMGWTQEEVGLAALELLAAHHGLVLSEPADGSPPHWSGGPKPAPKRCDQGVELFLSIGRSRGVRPGDIVGALTAEAGVTGQDLGRVTIGAHKSFVGVSAVVADRILDAAPALTIRGVDVRVARAFARGGRRDRR